MKRHRKNNEKTSNDRSRVLTFVSYEANITPAGWYRGGLSFSLFYVGVIFMISEKSNMDDLTLKLVEKLSPESKHMLMKEYESKKMSSTVAWVMWLFGWHYAYMGQRGKQIIYWATFFGLLIWWIVEAFRLNGKIAKYNDGIMSDLLIKYKLYDKS